MMVWPKICEVGPHSGIGVATGGETSGSGCDGDSSGVHPVAQSSLYGAK